MIHKSSASRPALFAAVALVVSAVLTACGSAAGAPTSGTAPSGASPTAETGYQITLPVLTPR